MVWSYPPLGVLRLGKPVCPIYHKCQRCREQLSNDSGKTRMPLETIYEQMAQFPMATLEKFTLQTADLANVHEESKILGPASRQLALTRAEY